MTRDTSDFSTVLLNATYLALYVQQTFQDGGKKSLAIIIAHRKVWAHIQWLAASFCSAQSRGTSQHHGVSTGQYTTELRKIMLTLFFLFSDA